VNVEVPADEVTAIFSTRSDAGSMVARIDPTTPESPSPRARAAGEYVCGAQVWFGFAPPAPSYLSTTGFR